MRAAVHVPAARPRPPSRFVPRANLQLQEHARTADEEERGNAEEVAGGDVDQRLGRAEELEVVGERQQSLGLAEGAGSLQLGEGPASSADDSRPASETCESTRSSSMRSSKRTGGFATPTSRPSTTPSWSKEMICGRKEKGPAGTRGIRKWMGKESMRNESLGERCACS